MNPNHRLSTAIALVLRSMRPKQWIKNLFVFAPIIFSLEVFRKEQLGIATVAFFLFCILSGVIYLFNDVLDRKADRLHPKKRNRPVASGRLRPSTAVIWALILIVVALCSAFLLSSDFFRICLIYVLINIAYSTLLKHVVILDVMLIATGFVLRVMAGGAVNRITLSPWILLITFLLSIFIAFVKRRQEIVRYQELGEKGKSRMTLDQYNIPFLDQLISISTATTLISYLMYVLDPGIKGKFQTDKLFFTIPFVIFGIFRYLYLAYVNQRGESPEEVVVTDLPFLANLVLWLVVFVWIIHG